MHSPQHNHISHSAHILLILVFALWLPACRSITRTPAAGISGAPSRNYAVAPSDDPQQPLRSATQLAGPPAFSGDTVTIRDFLAQLELEIQATKTYAHRINEFKAFAKKHSLDASDDALFSEYVTVKTLYEATRGGGLWGVHWDITNKEPDSRQIWKQWRDASPESLFHGGTAMAECDEISALFSFLSFQLGVKRVGLFWPTWNHTVAVWPVTDSRGRDVRIVVPTTHIFLDYEDHFDSVSNPDFDPWKQRGITPYSFADAESDETLPAVLANWFIAQVRIYGAASEQTLHYLAYQRRRIMNNPGAVSDVRDEIRSVLQAARKDTAMADAEGLSAFLESIP